MATKLYLRSLTADPGAPFIGEKSTAMPLGTLNTGGPADATQTGQRRPMTQRMGTGGQTTSQWNAIAQTAQQSAWIGRWVSPPLAAQTIPAATWTVACAVAEANTNANSFLRVSVYVWRPSTRAIVGFVTDAAADLGLEWTTTETGLVATFSGAAVTCKDEDVLVAEFWHRATQAMATAYQNNFWFNGGTDPANGVATTDAASFLSTPSDLTFLNPPYRVAFGAEFGNKADSEPDAVTGTFGSDIVEDGGTKLTGRFALRHNNSDTVTYFEWQFHYLPAAFLHAAVRTSGPFSVFAGAAYPLLAARLCDGLTQGATIAVGFDDLGRFILIREGTVLATGFTAAVDTWYVVELDVPSYGASVTVTARIYSTSGTLLDTLTAGAVDTTGATAGIGTVRLGQSSGFLLNGITNIWFDDLVVGGGGAIAQALASDNFNRADSADLGANWTPVVNSLKIMGNQVRPGVLSAVCWERYSAVSWPDAQYSQVVVRASTAGATPGPAVRMGTGSPETGYFAEALGASAGKVWKAIAGSYTQIGTLPVINVGDTLRLEAVGNILTVKVNGVVVFRVVDAGIASGSAGMKISNATAETDAQLDDWEGGSLAGVDPAARCFPLNPNANGGFTAWTGVFSDVDDMADQAGPDALTDEISTTTVDAKESVALEDLAAGSTVFAAALLARNRAPAAAGCAHLFLYDGTTEYYGGPWLAVSALATDRMVALVMPNGAAWTLAGLNALQIGVRQEDADNAAVRCFLLYAVAKAAGETPISQTAAHLWEGLQGVRPAAVQPWEARAYIAQTRAQPWEAPAGIARTAVQAWESLLGVATARAQPWEALGLAARALAQSWESAGVIAAARAQNWEALLSLAAAALQRWEGLLGLAQTRAHPWEALQRAARTAAQAWEAGGTVASAAAQAWEAGGTVAKQATQNWEATLAAVARQAVQVWEALAFVSSAGQRLASDDFNRADNPDLGANWTPVVNSLKIVGNQVRPGVLSAVCWERYSAVAWPDAQYSQVVVKASLNGESPGPVVRMSAGAPESGYFAEANGAGSGRLWKAVAGAYTQLATFPPVNAGDVLRLEAERDRLAVKVNGASVLTYFDDGIASGSAGMKIAGATDETNAQMDDWEGGSVLSTAQAWEALGRASSARVQPWEAGGTVAKPAAQNWEAGAGVVRQLAQAWEALQRAARTAGEPWEALALALGAAAQTWEAGGTVTKGAAQPWEGKRTLAAAAPQTWEALLTASRQLAQAWEALARAASGRAQNWEAGGTVTKSAAQAWEAAGTAAAQASQAWEAVARIAAAATQRWEAEAAVSRSAAQVWEALARAARQAEQFWESAQFIPPIFGNAARAEFVQAARAAGAAAKAAARATHVIARRKIH